MLLGVAIGAKGAASLLLPVAAVTITTAIFLTQIVRLTRTRQRWSLALAVAVDIAFAVVCIFLIVTMQFRSTDANTIFFIQMLITPALIFAVASAWHFLRGAAWFNGEREVPLRAEESGARPIAAPLIKGSKIEDTTFGPDLAAYSWRFGAYVFDAALIAIVGAIALAAGMALGSDTGTGLRIGLIVGGIVSVGYFPYFWTRGQTPGMRLGRVRVVHEVGSEPLSWGTSIRRYVVFVFGAAVFFVGWLWVFVDPRRKAWHDIAARTLVVHAAAAPVAANPATAVAAAPAAAPATDAPVVDNVPSDDAPAMVIEATVADEAARPVQLAKGQPLVVVQGLKKHFPIYGGILRHQIGTVYAVDGVDFDIMPGETFSLVGESGLRQDDARPHVHPAHAIDRRSRRVRRL